MLTCGNSTESSLRPLVSHGLLCLCIGRNNQTVEDEFEMASEQPSPSLREDLVANAVGFLSNPKVCTLIPWPASCGAFHPSLQVRASAEGPKRQFLENKGLTTAEIDEAFRRVPNDLPAPSPPTTSATAPAKPFHTAVVPTQQQQLQPVPQGIRWSQVVIGATLLAAGAYTVHSLLWPRAHQLYQRWTSSWREAQQQQEQRAAANAKVLSSNTQFLTYLAAKQVCASADGS